MVVTLKKISLAAIGNSIQAIKIRRGLSTVHVDGWWMQRNTFQLGGF